MTLIKIKNWLLKFLKTQTSDNRPVIIPREITPIDLRFEDTK